MSSDPPTSDAAVVDATNPDAAPSFTTSPSFASSSSAAAVSESSRGWYLTRRRTSFAVGTSSGGSASTCVACVSPLSPLSPLPASPLSAALCLYPLTTAPGTLDTPPKPSCRTVLYPRTTPLADFEKMPPTPRPTPLTPPHTRPTSPRDSPSFPAPPTDLMSAPTGGSSSAATGTGPHRETDTNTSASSPRARRA